MPVKIISTDGCENKVRVREGLALENLVNDFCKGKEIISVQFEFNPAISVRHLAYITYKDSELDQINAQYKHRFEHLKALCLALAENISLEQESLWQEDLEATVDCIVLEKLEDTLGYIEEYIKGSE